MLLDDLVGVIETLKGRIAAHGSALRENETRTRMALIDPLLQALGWDVSDPEMVTPEYSVGASRADYALLTPAGTPSALVEAKKLDESLASHRMQMLNYANISGIPHAGLSDGNHWEMYTVFDQAPIEQRRILDVSISNTPAHEAALKLLLLWRPNLASGQAVMANAPALLVPTSVPSTPVQHSEITVPVQPNFGMWTPLSEIDNPTGKPRPMSVRFNSGEETVIKAWHNVLTQTAEWLASTGRLTPATLPANTSKSWNFASTTSKKGDGKDFLTPHIISNGIHLETHLSSRAAISCTYRLLNHCNVDPATVELRFE